MTDIVCFCSVVVHVDEEEFDSWFKEKYGRYEEMNLDSSWAEFAGPRIMETLMATAHIDWEGLNSVMVMYKSYDDYHKRYEFRVGVDLHELEGDEIAEAVGEVVEYIGTEGLTVSGEVVPWRGGDGGSWS